MNAQTNQVPADRGALMFFNDFEARTVEAIAERIVPGDGTDAGATDANVTTYIDRAVAGFSTGLQKVYRLGIRDLDAFLPQSLRQHFRRTRCRAPGHGGTAVSGPGKRDCGRIAQACRRGRLRLRQQCRASRTPARPLVGNRPGRRPAGAAVCGRARAHVRGHVLRPGLWRQSPRPSAGSWSGSPACNGATPPSR